MWQETLRRYHAAVADTAPLVEVFTTALLDRERPPNEGPVITSRYRALFGPNDEPDLPYPLSHLGSTTRVDRHYLPRWIDLQALLRAVLEDTNSVATSEDAGVRDCLIDAIGLIGSSTYTSESVFDPNPATEVDQDASAPAVFGANALLGFEVGRLVRAQRAAHLPSLQPLAQHRGSTSKVLYSAQDGAVLRVLDMGTGRGDTIVPVLRQIALAGMRKVSLSLLDASARSLNYAAERVIRVMEVARSTGAYSLEVEIEALIEANLYELGRSVLPRPWQYDVVVSGGAYFRSTDKQRIFEWVRASLVPGGRLAFWDWFASCWAGPTLAVAAEDGFAPHGAAAITEADLPALEQTWIHGWLGERGYFNFWAGEHNDRINEEFTQAMTRLKDGEPFSFLSWLQSVADRYPAPPERGHQLCIEGYTEPSLYIGDLEAAGMLVTAAQTVEQLRNRHGRPRLRIARQDFYRDTIRFITAVPKNS